MEFALFTLTPNHPIMERQRRWRNERGAENNGYGRSPYDENPAEATGSRYSMYNNDNDNYVASNYYDDEEYDRWSSVRNHVYNSDHDNYGNQGAGPYFPEYDEAEFEDDDFDNEYAFANERRDGRKRGGFEAMDQNNRYGGNRPDDREYYDRREHEGEEGHRQHWPTDSYFSMPGQSRGRVRRQTQPPAEGRSGQRQAGFGNNRRRGR
jgi:hypothetical protein